jgi:hypothetical protein
VKGWRTLVANLLLAIAPVLEATTADGIGLTGVWATLYSLLVIAVNFALRFITTTPVGTKP